MGDRGRDGGEAGAGRTRHTQGPAAFHLLYNIVYGLSVSGYEPCAKIVGCLLASVLFARRTTGIESNRFRAMQVELAAHAVVVSLSYFSWVLPFGISMACNIRVGNQGSRELRQ